MGSWVRWYVGTLVLVRWYVGKWVRWYDDLDDCTSELLPSQEDVDPLQELLDGLP